MIPVYAPPVDMSVAVDSYAEPGGIKYASNSTLAYYDGLYWLAFDGSTTGYAEGETDQRIFMVTSPDGLDWSEPFEPFADSDYTSTPIAAGSALEWQPNLLVVGDELWCFWAATGPDAGYLSVYDGADWVTRRFEFSSSSGIRLSTTLTGSYPSGWAAGPTIGGDATFAPFFPCNPVAVGAALYVPVIYTSANDDPAKASTATGWKGKKKRNGFLRLLGGVWEASNAVAVAGGFNAWEPFMESSARLYHRALDGRRNETDMLYVSDVDGLTVGAPRRAGLIVPSSRGYALHENDAPVAMVHCDMTQGDGLNDVQTQASARKNGAIFVPLHGGGWAPGPTFSGALDSVVYPQVTRGHDGDLRVNFSYGNGGASNSRRSLYVAKVPAPPEGVFLAPRNRQRFIGGDHAPLVDGQAFRFDGSARADSTATLDISGGVTVCAWLTRETIYGMVADLRAETGGNGGIFQVTGAGAVGSTTYVPNGFPIPFDAPAFLACRLDPSGSVDQFFALPDGTHDSVVTAVAAFSMAPQGVTIGYKSSPKSAVTGFGGLMHAVRVFEGLLTEAEIWAVSNLGAPGLTPTPITTGSAAPTPDATYLVGDADDFEVPDTPVPEVVVDGDTVTITGQEAALIRVKPVSTLQFTVAVDPGSDTDRPIALAGFGDANQYVQLEYRPSDPGHLYVGRRRVAALVEMSASIVATVYPQKVVLGEGLEFPIGVCAAYLGHGIRFRAGSVTSVLTFTDIYVT